MQQTSFKLKLAGFSSVAKKPEFFSHSLTSKFCVERFIIPNHINFIKAYKNNLAHFNSPYECLSEIPYILTPFNHD